MRKVDVPGSLHEAKVCIVEQKQGFRTLWENMWKIIPNLMWKVIPIVFTINLLCAQGCDVFRFWIILWEVWPCMELWSARSLFPKKKTARGQTQECPTLIYRSELGGRRGRKARGKHPTWGWMFGKSGSNEGNMEAGEGGSIYTLGQRDCELLIICGSCLQSQRSLLFFSHHFDMHYALHTTTLHT